MEDFIIIAILLIIIGFAAGYVIRAKKKGKKCIGCQGGCSSCHCCNDKVK